MKALLNCSKEWVDLGPDSFAGLRRGARMLRRNVFQCIALDNPVPTAWWHAGAPISFCDIVNAGLMTRDIEPGDFLDPDGYVVVYTVTGRVSFKDSCGKRWTLGTTDRWYK